MESDSTEEISKCLVIWIVLSILQILILKKSSSLNIHCEYHLLKWGKKWKAGVMMKGASIAKIIFW